MFEPNFGGIRGGELRIIPRLRGAEGTAPVRTCDERFMARTVLGQNPSRAEIEAALGNDPILTQIACTESNFRQFASSPGLPNVGSDRRGSMGFGVMQLTEPPATDDEIWDWRLNVVGGMRVYREKVQIAATEIAAIRQQYPAAPALTPDEMQYQILQRYNSGSYWSWDDVTKKWVRGGNGYPEKVLKCR